MLRRTFLQTLGTVSAASLLGAASWSGFRQAVIIDSMGGPGVTSDASAPLTPVELNDVAASGLTALNLTVSGVGSYARDYDETIREIAYWNAEVTAHPDVFLQILRASDIAKAKQSQRLGLIYGFQDVTALGEDINRVDLFRNLGVRIFQLTYNKRNLVGDGCLEPGNAGISEFGRKLIARLNESNLLVDLSHAGERTTLEAIDISKAPIAITHTGCAGLAANPRNKTDIELRKVADKGGYVGIYLMPFLRTQGQPMAEDVIRHIEHAVNVCGEDHVGIGTDGSISPVAVTPQFKKAFAAEVEARRKAGISAPGEDPNVYTFVPDLNQADRFSRIADLLADRKHSGAQIEKLLGGNFTRLLSQVWGS